MKVKDTDEILGGYSPIGWVRPSNNEDYKYKYCKDNFFFHLKIGLFKILFFAVTDPEHVILLLHTCGLHFNEGYDLAMLHNFHVKTDEYEIIQINKKAFNIPYSYF
ncbi:hypothetical protein C2G38_2237868 [Gigaspora rosea]|uniref:TLDc domain-containing protein n=1 Tax=Gigaspora rosea TaxID=44941 RepID=A0A397TSX5_9GLOM|nr:hypothetical protein C2G38_2237868 [Gigaspora rosea]